MKENVRAVDTTGAGDIFGGAAMSRILKYEKAPGELTASELKEIAEFACTAAGISVTRSGGIPSVPSFEEVYEKITK